MGDNPIEVQVDQEKEKEKEEAPELPPKKGGFLNPFLSCMGGKSSDAAKKKDKMKGRAPAQKPEDDDKKEIDKKFYEEGEKRKLKKLSKDERDKKDMYFVETENEP